jgi:hypothetical protein
VREWLWVFGRELCQPIRAAEDAVKLGRLRQPSGIVEGKPGIVECTGEN